MRCSTLLAILTGVLLYLVLGAVVFRSLEAQQEEEKYTELQKMRRNFLLNFTCIGPDNLQELIEVEQSSSLPNFPFAILHLAGKRTDFSVTVLNNQLLFFSVFIIRLL